LVSELVLRAAVWLAQAGASETSLVVVEALKIVVPVVAAIIGSQMLSRREQSKARLVIEERNRLSLAGERDKLISGWQELTAQARETVTRAYAEAAEAVAARRMAETRLVTLEGEMVTLRSRYDAAIEELRELRQRGSRR